MSKSAKSAESSLVSPSSGETEIAFEEALARLETIVEGMETAEMPLEKLLAHFEEGARLARICQTRLAAAEVRVQQIEKNVAGDWEVRPASLAGAGDPA